MAVLKLITGPATEPVTVADVLPYARIDESNQEPAPRAVTVALVASPSGILTAGVHRVLATFVTADGETQAGETSIAFDVPALASTWRLSISDIPIGGSFVTARKLYMTEAGGSTFLYAATIANNTDTTASLNIADASLGAQAPTVNATADWMLSMFIMAGRQQAENLTRRALITQTWELYLDEFPSWDMFLPKPALQSVTTITYVDETGTTQTLAANQYAVDTVSEPGRIQPVYGVVWPFTRRQANAVCVRFVAGYGAAVAVPAAIRSWILMRVSTAFQNREDLQIAYRQTLVQLPPSFIDGLLDPFRVEYFGPLNERSTRSPWAGSDIIPTFGAWGGML